MDNTRIDDQYLIQVLKLNPGFISRHAKAMGNRTRPRSYFLDTVLAYLRKLEKDSQRGSAFARQLTKEEAIRFIEEKKTKWEKKKAG